MYKIDSTLPGSWAIANMKAEKYGFVRPDFKYDNERRSSATTPLKQTTSNIPMSVKSVDIHVLSP
jgi:hypothetical protein